MAAMKRGKGRKAVSQSERKYNSTVQTEEDSGDGYYVIMEFAELNSNLRDD